MTEGKAKGLPSGLIIFPGFSESLLKELWAVFQVWPPGFRRSALLRQGSRGACSALVGSMVFYSDISSDVEPSS